MKAGVKTPHNRSDDLGLVRELRGEHDGATARTDKRGPRRSNLPVVMDDSAGMWTPRDRSDKKWTASASIRKELTRIAAWRDC